MSTYHEEELLKLNREWAGAEYAPDVADWASRRGIELKTTPPLIENTLSFVDEFAEKIGVKLGISNRPFVIGSSIYSPEMEVSDEHQVMIENPDGSRSVITKPRTPQNKRGVLRNKYTSLVRDEAPHVAQWRDEGTIGFIGRHASDLLKHGTFQKTYNIEGTHEHDAHSNPEKEKELLESLELLEGYSEEKRLPFNY